MQTEFERGNKWEQLLDVKMQKPKQIWNQDAKRSPKTTTSHKTSHTGHIKVA